MDGSYSGRVWRTYNPFTKVQIFPYPPLSGCKSMVDGHIWDVEAGGSNPLTQARGFYFSISLCHPNKENK